MREDGRETVRIVAYGTLMSGECNHHVCGKIVKLTPCVIRGNLYDTLRGYPAFVSGGEGAVAAELIEIPVAVWPEIDALEEYPTLYDRQLIAVKLPDQSTAEAWVYVMRRLPAAAVPIACGDWRKRDLH